MIEVQGQTQEQIHTKRPLREVGTGFLAPLRNPSNHRYLDLKPSSGSALDEILAGLQAPRKCLDPKFLYDETGSRLFERICETSEYYVTRAERAILEKNAREMADALGEDAVVFEPGSGNSEKIRYLLEESTSITRYVGIDIDAETVFHSTRRIAGEFPDLEVWGVCGNLRELERVPGISEISLSSNVLFFPGSTLGNFEPAEALNFLRKARLLLGPSGKVLLGVDRRKPVHLLHDAYNDSQGVTAAFNLNALNHLNDITGSDFDLKDFEHAAHYNTKEHRIEMHLRALRDHSVCVGKHHIAFAAGETIHTESSYKYDVNDIVQLASRAGFSLGKTWTDADDMFTVYLLQSHFSC